MSHRTGLTAPGDAQRRQQYIAYRIAGMDPTPAARAAGYKHPKTSSRDLERMPDVHDVIVAEIQNARMESKYTREGVMEVLDDAIGMARMISDPSAMVRGAAEINKMQGYYAPETKEIILSKDTARQLEQISNMSEADLLERLGKAPAFIDAQYEVVPDESEPESE